jgi:Protein of unknown function (DUF3592)
VRSAFNRRPRRAFILVFAALAAFCFVAAGRDGFERIQVLRTFERTEGEVTLELRRSSQVSGVARRPPYRATAEVFDYAPLVRFETAQGAVVTVAGEVRSSIARYKPGEKLPVYYDPRDPQQAVLGTFLEFWAPIVAWAGFGLVWALAAYGAQALTRGGHDDKRHRAKHLITSV